MKPLPLLTAGLLMVAGSAFASPPNIDRAVEVALQEYRVEADVASLSAHQKSVILSIAYSGQKNGRRMRINTVVNGGLLNLVFD